MSSPCPNLQCLFVACDLVTPLLLDRLLLNKLQRAYCWEHLQSATTAVGLQELCGHF